MKRPARSPQTGRAAPWQQANWDWRAAGNFIGGGSGGGLLIAAAAAPHYAPFALTAMLLVAAGLFCVWLEIGRPWRALNVFLHPGSSWMTREALLAPVLLLSAGAAAFSGAGPLLGLAAALGALFLYCQARILAADKGIPAWRHPRSVPLLVVTGLTEGAALFAALGALLPNPPEAVSAVAPLPAPMAPMAPTVPLVPIVLLALIALRAALWRRYLAALRAQGVPAKALAVLGQLHRPLLLAGHLAPAVLVAGGTLTAQPWLAAIGGLGAVAGGWTLKYTLLRRAGYTQGYALPHLPVRGQRAAGLDNATTGVQPGWSKPPLPRG